MAHFNVQNKNLQILKNRKQQVFILQTIGEALAIISAVGYLFYNSYIASIILLPYVYVHVKIRWKDYLNKRKELIARSFKDGMQVVKNTMQTGYSIENAFREAVKEVEFLYGKDNEVYIGFSKMTNLLSLNIPIEDAFFQFAEPIQNEDISYFAEILRYAKRTGGNLVQIIQNTAEIIADKIEIKQEINTIISGKKYEQIIMSIIPACIIMYMRVSSLGMMEKLYGNILGIMIMSICLIIYALGVILARKIVRIVV